ncbi:MAG: polymerase sigma-54 factor [Herbinix sp.]|nr:polymerase sigma-54 factor [Herbinix sp.]
MDMSMKQKMQQEQKLILTTEMQLSLKLLQMPINDLQECIEKELDENPILEIDDTISDDATKVDENKEDFSIKEEIFDYSSFLQQSKYDGNIQDVSYIDNDEDNINNPFNYISKTTSLKEYLKDQLIERNDNKEIKNISEYLIECMNADGFITDDIKDIVINIAESYEKVNSALKIVQDLQPWGIGAKDFKESLVIQLRKKNISDNKIYIIINNFLDLLADNKYKELAHILNVDIETIGRYADIIKSLEPKPARGFYTGEDTKYIIPEAFIKKIGKEYYIIMNDDMLPKLNVNTYYCDIIKEDNNSEAVNFIKDKVNSALYLIKGIEQRRNTIYRVLEKIMEFQRDYFDKGELYLKPMNMKDISVDLNLHESTVSRAIKEKYISIPMGTVKIKDLFTNGIYAGDSSEDVSTKTIKNELEKMIREEDKHHPRSDQDLCDILNSMNLNISRRTVAKYREELGIRSSSKRKLFN